LPSPGTCRIVAGALDIDIPLDFFVDDDAACSSRRRLVPILSSSHIPGMRRYLEIKNPFSSISGEGFQGGKWILSVFSPFKEAPGSCTVRGMEVLELVEDGVDVVVASIQVKHPTTPTTRAKNFNS
jgi:hypothetical protein